MSGRCNRKRENYTMDSQSFAELGWRKTLIEGFEHLGLDGNALLTDAGISSSSPEELIGGALSDAVGLAFELAIVRSGDPALGLKMARHPLKPLSVLSHVVLSAATAEQSLRVAARYVPTFWPMVTMHVQTLPDRTLVTLGMVPGKRPVPPACFDFFVTMLISGYRIVTGQRAKLLVLHYPGARPENPQPWLDAFGCDVDFGSHQCMVEVCVTSVRRRIPTANPAIFELSERIAEQASKRQFGVTSSRVRNEIVKCLGKGEPRREAIAAQLGMSERTLCRRLSDEHTNFVAVLDALRREMAETYMQQGDFNPTEITYALGFSDPSNFYRACKRWFGSTPNALRQSGLTPKPVAPHSTARTVIQRMARGIGIDLGKAMNERGEDARVLPQRRKADGERRSSRDPRKENPDAS